MSPSLTLASRIAAVAALAGLGGLLSACGTGSPSATATKTITETVPAGAGASSTSAATTPAGPPGCLASALQAQLGVSQGTAGTIYQVVVLTNTSTATCTLYGFPGVSFVTGVGGLQVGAPATRVSGVPVSLVTLAAGGKANLLLAVHDAGAYSPAECHMTTVHWLRVYPPGDYGALYLQYNTPACAKASKSIMTVTPVRAGAVSASY